MNNLRLTHVVKNLLILNVLFYIVSFLVENPAFIGMKREAWALFYVESPFFRPWQLATHFFMHADIGHLFFNMFTLVIFGPALETLLGEKRFLGLYFFSALGSTILGSLALAFDYHYLGNMAVLGTPSLGASGAIYGIAAGFALKFPYKELHLLFLPFSIKAIYLVLLMISWDLFAGFQGFETGIGHFAHLGGALFGFLLIDYWEKHSDQYRP